MPNENTNVEQKQELNMQTLIKGLLESSPYLKGAYKQAQKQGATDFEQAAQAEGGQVANEQLLGQILKLAETPVSTGKRMGLGTSLIKGHGTERPYYQEPLGVSPAIQLQKLMSAEEDKPREEAKDILGMTKTAQDIAAGTPEGIQQTELNKIRGQVLAQEEKEGAKAGRNVKAAENSLKLVYKTWTDMVNKTKEDTGLEPGRIAGVYNIYGALTGKNPYVKPFRGQVVQATARIAKIAAPSAKVGPQLLKVFDRTMPTEWDNLAESKGQIVTSMTESAGYYAATHPDEFPDGFDIETFQALTSEMLDNLISIQQGADQTDTVVRKQSTTEKLKNKVKTISDGQTATNPKTGEKIVFRGGKWQKI